MENDIKDTVKKLEEAKRKQEKIERIIILLSGFLVILISAIIGINIYYKGGEEKVSQPEIVIADEENAPVSLENKNQALKEEVKKELSINKNKPKITQNIKETSKTDNKQIAKIDTKGNKQNTSTSKPEKKVSQVKTIKEKKKVQNIQKLEKQKVVKKKTTQNVKKAVFYSVQVGAFKSKENAQKFLKKLKLKGFIKEEGGFYRVFVGKFNSYKETSHFLKKHSLKGFIRKVKFD